MRIGLVCCLISFSMYRENRRVWLWLRYGDGSHVCTIYLPYIVWLETIVPIWYATCVIYFSPEDLASINLSVVRHSCVISTEQLDGDQTLSSSLSSGLYGNHHVIACLLKFVPTSDTHGDPVSTNISIPFFSQLFQKDDFTIECIFHFYLSVLSAD